MAAPRENEMCTAQPECFTVTDAVRSIELNSIRPLHHLSMTHLHINTSSLHTRLPPPPNVQIRLV
jgi:hypothetical protein